ncbi:MAG: sulfatase [Fuerstiella sp.]|nr:sulfatase [Fuerstiella sp.]
MFRTLLMHLLLYTFALFAAVHSPAADRPNIIFLMADDQATYSMGCYNTPGAKTPNLDGLAADGMVFDAHYDTTAICMASRANVMTGMFEYKTGCNFEHGALLRDHWAMTYPVLLREAGYRTAFAGKFGFEVTNTPETKGVLPEGEFDVWGGGPGQTSYDTKKNKSMKKYVDQYPHSTLSYGAFGRDFVTESAVGDKPFCLSISFKAPHHPVQPDPKFDDVYRDMTFSKPGNYGREFGEHFSLQSRQGRQYERFHSWKYSTEYNKVMALYFQQIYAIDVAVGMIRKAVEAAGVAKNTIVIYTSDNGFMNGSHGYGSKVLPYEESTRVPLIVFDPRHSNSGKQLRCGSLTGNVDFAPTILELAGLPVPENIDGKSLMTLYDDPNSATHESLPLINVWGPKDVHSLGVVTKDWKYVYWPYAADDFKATEELFALKNDRLELSNSAMDVQYSKTLARMQATYDAAVAHWSDTAVEYHNYKPYGTIFDRGVEWPVKARLMRGKKNK